MDHGQGQQPNTNGSERSRKFLCGVVEGFYGKPWTCDQRKDLFKKMHSFGLNSFMYAPKDDVKHRANWRELYTKDEEVHLRSLIEEAKRYNIDFYYSLAPGLDMVYSNSKEVSCLIRKYDQLVALGCTSFALLFDDIEPVINNTDKQVFHTYAAAQVAVTNLIYDHLGKPKFLFCPTEYCESRAVPSVLESEYLNTIGTSLQPEIDIMWSGSRVISKIITEDSIIELTRVIRRAPLIWENLHANDYDKKRIFLGPYCGRSTKIIPKLRGVLTNPNCEYEANYIPIHTLAQWSRCSEDAEPRIEYFCDMIDLKIQDKSPRMHEKDEDSSKGNDSTQQACVYDPRIALEEAIKDWLPLFTEYKESSTGERLGDYRQSGNVALSATMNQFNKIKPAATDAMDEEESACSSDHIKMNSSDESLNDICRTSTNQLEHMHSEPFNESRKEKDSEPMECNISEDKGTLQAYGDCPFCCDQQRMSKYQEKYKQLSHDHLALLVDLFYLPFEHGSKGLQLLREFQWLKANCDVLSNKSHSNNLDSDIEIEQSDDMKYIKPAKNTTSLSDEESPCTEEVTRTPELWYKHAENFENLSSSIAELLYRLTTECQNRSFFYEIYPYLSEMRDVTCLLCNYVRCVGGKNTPLDEFYDPLTYRGCKEGYTPSEQEPWIFKGGLIGDLQRLLPSAKHTI